MGSLCTTRIKIQKTFSVVPMLLWIRQTLSFVLIIYRINHDLISPPGRILFVIRIIQQQRWKIIRSVSVCTRTTGLLLIMQKFVYSTSTSQHGGKPLAIIKLDKNGRASWKANFKNINGTIKRLVYVLRVYGNHGKFDETTPLPLWVVDKLHPDNIKHQLTLRCSRKKK